MSFQPGSSPSSGVSRVQALVDASYPVEPPVGHDRLEQRAALLASLGREPPSPGPIPPIFERFTAQARAAVNADVGVAAAVRDWFEWPRLPARLAGPMPPWRSTGIFTPEVRRIVSKDVLIVAERLDHRTLTTGHVLLAILERYRYLTVDFVGAQGVPRIREATEAVTAALPGQEET